LKKVLIYTFLKMALSVCLIIVFWGCSSVEEMDDSGAVLSGKKVPDNEIYNMDFVITDKGIVTNKIKAGYVKRNNQGSSNYSLSEISEGLEIKFFQKGKLVGFLKSRKGIINDRKNTLTAIEDVVVVSTKGDTIYTEELEWNRKKGKVYSNKDVMVVNIDKDTLTGNGFIGDQNFETYEIIRPRGKTRIKRLGSLQ